MKILIINSVCGIKSTGRICTDLACMLEKEGNEVKIAYGRDIVLSQFKKICSENWFKLRQQFARFESKTV